MHSLLTKTNRFDSIHKIIDYDAESLKDSLRDLLKPSVNFGQIFFYFSGHGHSDSEDFYFCMKDFNERRPNETGLSNRDLHALLREVSPDLVVKVIDACSSGALLVKSVGDLLPLEKGGLKNVVQIASCLDSQTSLTGDPLSEFTHKFCAAASRKDTGPIYYTDIIAILRDEYLQDTERSPHFVFQASARETFIDDASLLSPFRIEFTSKWAPKTASPIALVEPPAAGTEQTAPSLANLLASMESEIVKPHEIKALTDKIFDGLKRKINDDKFNEYFDLEINEYSDFEVPETRSFIIRTMSQEKKNDDFVTATIRTERKPRNPLLRITEPMLYALGGDEEYTEKWNLKLNMRMDRVQMQVILTPKFTALQQIKLVVTCAPSLETCYLFELATRHARTDWNAFAPSGTEVTKRWYKLNWRQNVDHLIDSIADQLSSVIMQHLDAIAKRLAKE